VLALGCQSSLGRSELYYRGGVQLQDSKCQFQIRLWEKIPTNKKNIGNQTIWNFELKYKEKWEPKAIPDLQKLNDIELSGNSEGGLLIVEYSDREIGLAYRSLTEESGFRKVMEIQRIVCE